MHTSQLPEILGVRALPLSDCQTQNLQRSLFPTGRGVSSKTSSTRVIFFSEEQRPRVLGVSVAWKASLRPNV